MLLRVWCQGKQKGYFVTAQYLLMCALIPSIFFFFQLKCAFIFTCSFHKPAPHYSNLLAKTDA